MDSIARWLATASGQDGIHEESLILVLHHRFLESGGRLGGGNRWRNPQATTRQGPETEHSLAGRRNPSDPLPEQTSAERPRCGAGRNRKRVT